LNVIDPHVPVKVKFPGKLSVLGRNDTPPHNPSNVKLRVAPYTNCTLHPFNTLSAGTSTMLSHFWFAPPQIPQSFLPEIAFALACSKTCLTLSTVALAACFWLYWTYLEMEIEISTRTIDMAIIISIKVKPVLERFMGLFA
jgi:hypothetical protein